VTETGIAISAEQLAPLPGGIELAYQTFGDPQDEPLLLVMGLAGHLTWWDDDLCRLLAHAGFHVIRYDNRDMGHSTRLREPRVNRRTLVRAFLGRRVRIPYTLQDLADDAFGLLDHLGITSAHVVGVSMGGMIAQTMALSHPDRVRTLTSVMSTTGRRTVGWQDPRLFPRLLKPTPRDIEAYVAANVAFWLLIGSPGYPLGEDYFSRRARLTWERGTNPAGVMRQILAVLTQPDRTQELRGLTMPALVIHGLQDRLVHVSGGRATARAIPGAELVLIQGMGHDLPRELFPHFVELIRGVADRANRRQA